MKKEEDSETENGALEDVDDQSAGNGMWRIHFLLLLLLLYSFYFSI